MQLSNENIAKTIEDLLVLFEKAEVSRRDVLKICLIVEEALLRWQEHFGMTHEFKVYNKKWFGAPKIVISLGSSRNIILGISLAPASVS